ncbi:class II aaRS and biotin synthetase [Lactarius psammicola]|nr:class II aaRS and biotin synthetase [Lactarius psammicola]
MNVLIYASSASPGLSNVLRSVLSPLYTVQSITPTTLATQPWSNSCALLVLSSPPDALGSLSLPSQAHTTIQQYIATGGRMLGFGLGVSVLSHRPAQDHFNLWDARSRAAIVPEAPCGVSARSSPASIRLRTGTLLSGLRPAGVSFELTHTTSDVIHGHWEGPADAIAGIQIPVGSGLAGFWGVSFNGTDDSPSSLTLLRYALASLGLTIPAESSNESLSALPPVPKYPLPQFFLHQYGKRQIVETVLERLGLSIAESSTDAGVFKDAVDTYHFCRTTLEGSARLVAEARASTELATHAPRVVLILPPDVLPPQELTPRFDAGRYFAVLEEVRGDQASVFGRLGSRGSSVLWGSSNEHTDDAGEVRPLLLLRDIVTGTFSAPSHRNPRFLTSLPAPVVSLATFQLTGRGRGSNTWLSPEGCLQFSLLVRAPLGAFPAPRLVFVQYLAGLAVVNACRDGRVLGNDHGARVKLKWPNDVYIELPGSDTKKKVGGILVNTSFSGGNMDVVVGFGINVSTPVPVTSLSQLSPPGQRLGAETLLALVLTKFEQLWATFVRGRGGWAAFEDAYLDAWMHSDQLVTLTTVEPPRPVRIVGITHDYGLLRTLPERTGWSRTSGHGVEDDYIDLQPDGNSFDIMTGLIKTKK